jgi:hypothetical protein
VSRWNEELQEVSKVDSGEALKTVHEVLYSRGE